MPDARSVVAQIQKDLEQTTERLLRHPYLEALGEGRIAKEGLRPFAGEQFHIIESDLRSVAYLVSRFGNSPSRDFFLGILQGERAAMEALLVFAGALGLSEPALRAYDPTPGAHAYTAYMAWLALYGSAAQVAAGYLVNFPAWGRSCGRLAAVLRARLGFAEEEVRFFQLFATPPPTFEEAALRVIQRGLDSGEEPAAIGRTARLLQAYELMYWDTLQSISGV